MKFVATLAAVALAAVMTGCEADQDATANLGAVSGETACSAEGSCCGSCDGKAEVAPAAMSECGADSCGASGCADKASCSEAPAAMGAVSEGACSAKSECASSCSEAPAAMGAMSEGSCSAKCSG